MFKRKTMRELEAERKELGVKLTAETRRRKVKRDISRIKAVRKKHSPVRKFGRIIKKDAKTVSLAAQKGVLGGLKHGTAIAKEGKAFFKEIAPPPKKGKKKSYDPFGLDY